MSAEYDFIVVGSGAGGGPLAVIWPSLRKVFEWLCSKRAATPRSCWTPTIITITRYRDCMHTPRKMRR